jgi:hypothetical protein
MATSLVHVLTIIGKAAEEVEAVCEEMLGRRIQQRATSYGSTDWTARDHEDLNRLCTGLVNAARKLPILYYAQYLDSWSVADARFQPVKWLDGRRRQICGSHHGLVFYPSKFAQDFIEQIGRLRNSQIYQNQTEDRWYLDRLKEAIDAALWLQARFLVVSFSEVIGPSRDDDEIRAALEASIGLNDWRGT